VHLHDAEDALAAGPDRARAGLRTRRFVAARPVTLASDGRPLRVEIGRTRLPAKVELVLWPELWQTISGMRPPGRPRPGGYRTPGCVL
jgi:hypothetical protein